MQPPWGEGAGQPQFTGRTQTRRADLGAASPREQRAKHLSWPRLKAGHANSPSPAFPLCQLGGVGWVVGAGSGP